MSSYEEALDDWKADMRDAKEEQEEEQTPWPPCHNGDCEGTMKDHGNDELVCTHCREFDLQGMRG